MSSISTSPDPPDPWAPLQPELERCATDPWVGAPCEVWVTPAFDGRNVPGDALDVAWQLPEPPPPPAPNRRRNLVERTNFVRLTRTDVTQVAWEVVRVAYPRPGWLARIATYLRVEAVGGGVVFESNDLTSPQPFPLSLGAEVLSIRWHLRFDETIGRVGDPPWIVALPSQAIPTAHTVGDLNSSWVDMRYSWAQRTPNKIGQVRGPGHVRLFAEVIGNVLSSIADIRVGGTLAGWEGM